MIKLYAFGAPIVVAPGGSRLDDLGRQPKRLGLLLYISAGERRVLRRDELLAVFWPESDDKSARNCLRQALHVLRHQLGRGVILGEGDQEVTVSPERLESDVAVFTRALQGGFAEAALEVYRGDFLAGFYLPEHPAFERWVEERRQRLASLAVAGAKQLAHAAEGAQDVTGALHWWRRTAQLVPFDEVVTRRIVSLLLATGNRGEAMRTLRSFTTLLRTELEVEPSRETQTLLQDAMDGGRPEMPEWFGDRRRSGSQDPSRQWRRFSDHAWT